MTLELFLHSPSGTIDLRPEDADRIRCHYYITQLADRGLGEAVQSLRDMVAFYTEDATPVLPPLPAQPVRTKVIGSYTSTVPPFSEE